MRVSDEQFEQLIDIMDLGMTLRQNQLNGSDTRSGREVLREFLDELPEDKPKYVVLGVGHQHSEASRRALEMVTAKMDGMSSVLVVGDMADEIAMRDEKPKLEDFILTAPARDFYLEDIDLNADAKQGTNPNGRKKGNSKKRRKR